MTKINSQRGQAVLIAVMLFLIVSTTVVFGLAQPVVRQLKIEGNLKQSGESYYLSEALMEDVVYRVKNNIDVDDIETLSLSGHTATSNKTTVDNTEEIVVGGDVNDRIRKVKTALVLDGGVGFAFGVQAGNGGFLLENSARIIGNVYSNGDIIGESNVIEGDAVAANSGNRIYDIRTFISAYADIIEDSVVEGDAHYVTSISDTTVLGSTIQESETEPPIELPISDEQIDSWQDVADDNVFNCSGEHEIKNTVTIGPIKYTCSVKFSNKADVTFAGHVWVEGDIIVENGSDFRIDQSMTDESVAIIAHDSSDTESSSTIILKNNSEFIGAPGNSYILFLSRNDSFENGGGTTAIEIQNHANGDILLYAGHGEVLIQNNVDLKEVVGYRVHIKNNATVEYESGLASLLFETGPSAGFNIDSWEEVE